MGHNNLNIVECFIEISKDSSAKYEINSKNQLKLDRVLFGPFKYPHNYGYIPNTLSPDRDPLDILLISLIPLHPGSLADARIIGAIEMIDDGDEDTKILGVMDKDPRLNQIQSLEDLPEEWLNEIKDFFYGYKKLEKKEVLIKNVIHLDQALSLIEQSKSQFLMQNPN